ncbi:MAG: nucleotidyltransferase family protein [Candidatus Marinimicrobia bacterium]|nr:nucleotidyltransferase family protein [Candidatus Neomarinimicrobiota bacterium]
MKSLQEIKSTLKQNKNHLFSEYPIKSIAIFGSYARKQQNNESDLDLIVEFNGKIGIRFIDLADEIENIVGFKVDLISRKGIRDKYYQSILSDIIYV